MLIGRDLALAIGFVIVAMSWVKAFGRKGRAIGKIAGFEWSGGRGFRVKKPRIRFEVDGAEYSFLPSLYLIGDYDETKKGTDVAVAFDPSNPKDADLASRGRRYGPPVVLTIIYLIVILIAFKQE